MIEGEHEGAGRGERGEGSGEWGVGSGEWGGKKGEGRRGTGTKGYSEPRGKREPAVDEGRAW